LTVFLSIVFVERNVAGYMEKPFALIGLMSVLSGALLYAHESQKKPAAPKQA
jgi:hypothetical protein